jgi:cytochrome c oxidase cbb3-type subunit III
MYFSQHKVRTSRIFTLCLCLGLLPAASIQSNAQANPQAQAQAKTDPMAAPNVQRGKAIFQQSCAFCHGVGATGGVGPNLLQSSLVQNQKYFGDAVVLVIQQGRVDRGMPAFPLLTNANISDILAYLHARIQVVESEPGSNDNSSLKRLLTGNAEAGKLYFNGEGKCSTCHSAMGDLAGIAKKYQPEELQGRFLYPPGHKDTATVSLVSGKQEKGKLLHLDAFYVAILNENGDYHSWPLRDVKVQVKDPLRAHEELLHNYKDKDVHDIFAYLETLK